MRALLAFLILGVSSSAWAAGYKVVLNEDSAIPITVFNLTFRVGSADDPAGRDGTAYLTARMLKEGGAKKWKRLSSRSREEIEEFLFPMAADIDVRVSKEQISFKVRSTAEDSVAVLETLAQMILAPAWEEKEFTRIRSEALEFLQRSGPHDDQEELGKIALDQAIYGPLYPYAHPEEGRVVAVQKMELSTLQDFYKTKFTQKRLTVGIAGAISTELKEMAKEFFAELPVGTVEKLALPEVSSPSQMQMTLVKSDFPGTGIHFGHPIPLNRKSPDFPAMYFVSTVFGKHRAFVGRLQMIVRETRGLNYGTYAYVEDFPDGGQLTIEPTQVARQQQAFTIWVRPTTEENGCFTLRHVDRAVAELVEKGVTEAEFKLVKDHLVGYLPILGASLERQLGYRIDSEFYGIQGDYLQKMQLAVQKLTRAEVNRKIKQYIHPKSLQVVAVVQDPEKFSAQILGEKCDVTYAKGVTHPKSLTDEDKKISTYRVPVKRENIRVQSAESFF